MPGLVGWFRCEPTPAPSIELALGVLVVGQAADANRVLGDPGGWPVPVELPDSLALCALNSVYPLQSGSAAGRSVLRKYRAVRAAAGADPSSNSGSDFLGEINAAGGPKAFA